MLTEKIRQLREPKQMLQGQISAASEMDNALHCKIERDENFMPDARRRKRMIRFFLFLPVMFFSPGIYAKDIKLWSPDKKVGSRHIGRPDGFGKNFG